MKVFTTTVILIYSLSVHSSQEVFVGELLMNPSKYENKEINVLGYVAKVRGQYGLYLSEGYAEAGSGYTRHKIAIKFDSKDLDVSQECHSRVLGVWGILSIEYGRPTLQLTKDSFTTNDEYGKEIIDCGFVKR